MELDAHDGITVVGGARDGRQPVAKRQPTEPQPLVLYGERALLIALFTVELRLEIVEQQVPAHAVTLPRGVRCA